MDTLLLHEMQAIRHALVRIAITLEDSRSVPAESTVMSGMIYPVQADHDRVQAGSEPALDEVGEGGEGVTPLAHDAVTHV